MGSGHGFDWRTVATLGNWVKSGQTRTNGRSCDNWQVSGFKQIEQTNKQMNDKPTTRKATGQIVHFMWRKIGLKNSIAEADSLDPYNNIWNFEWKYLLIF